MQQIVSSLIQYTNFQINVLLTHAVIFIVTVLITMMIYDNVASFITALFAALTVIGAIILSIVFSEENKQAVYNHEYVAVKNGKSLEIESKSEAIKSQRFEIDSEDSDHIYVKVHNFFSTRNIIVNKSEIDEVKN